MLAPYSNIMSSFIKNKMTKRVILDYSHVSGHRKKTNIVGWFSFSKSLILVFLSLKKVYEKLIVKRPFMNAMKTWDNPLIK